MRARVYFNLHKRMWSVQLKNARGNWYVAFHARAVLLHHVQWRVSEAGRQRVIREQRKNVHAFAVGTLLGMWDPIHTQAMNRPSTPLLESLPDVDGWGHVSYNPYRCGSFQLDGQPIEETATGYLAAILERPQVFAQVQNTGSR